MHNYSIARKFFPNIFILAEGNIQFADYRANLVMYLVIKNVTFIHRQSLRS